MRVFGCFGECLQRRIVGGCFGEGVFSEGELFAVSERMCAMKKSCWLFQKEWLWDTRCCWKNWPEHVSF